METCVPERPHNIQVFPLSERTEIQKHTKQAYYIIC